LSQSTCLCIN